MSETPEPATIRAQTRAAVDIESLVLTYSTLLFRVAHAMLRNPSEAEDAVQEAFLRVLAHQEKLPDVQNIRVWLVRIVWRLALDRARKIRPGQMDDAFARTLVAQHLPADEALAESRELQRVLLEMERLPAAEKHVLLLCAMEEMKTVEIAAVLGKSESAVRALLFRARTRLRDRLERQERKTVR
ncbi:MAG: RNA polymerase sigma factor [Janthinobacterium lividum]